ncbi:hypothetical protein RvY_14594 [Ramazzottius varieornatus]|uniref:LRAT domain-containing protein n=1 Tax=Ramazzottius varieornatus TaxID=947166 RepID=A0A1D1VTI9_RAMVA|nr:hypothetical protein RvY_14594 [Ramazzottius varieornatus]
MWNRAVVAVANLAARFLVTELRTSAPSQGFCRSSSTEACRMADNIPGSTSDERPRADAQGRPRHSSHLVTPFTDSAHLKPLPGDLIEFKRDLYSHWALYIGDGKVINVRGAQPGKSSDISMTGSATVRMEDLTTVAGFSQVRINNQEAEATSRGLQAIPVDELMEKAKKLVGTAVPYDVLSRNCEHYVTEWRYGEPWSEQVESGMKQFGDVRKLAQQKDLPELIGMLGNFMNQRR